MVMLTSRDPARMQPPLTQSAPLRLQQTAILSRGVRAVKHEGGRLVAAALFVCSMTATATSDRL